MKTILVLLALCSNALASDLPDLGEPTLGRYELSKGQIAAETAFVGLMLIDYRQTLDIRDWCGRNTQWRSSSWEVMLSDGTRVGANGESCNKFEHNSLLGRHPSDARVRNYFIGMTLAHVVIAKALPTEYRPYWIGIGIIVELAQVISNKKAGFSVNF